MNLLWRGGQRARSAPANIVISRDWKPYQGNSLLISWMKRPLGLSDPSNATATVVFAPSGTDIGAASEPSGVLTQPGCTEFTLMLVSLSSAARWIVNMLSAAFDAL